MYYNKNKGNLRFLKALIWFISIAIIVLLTIAGYMYFGSIMTANDISNVSEKVIVEDEKSADIEIDWESLEEINSDVVGWLEIPNTNINTPIVQSDDNTYYLKKDINKDYAYCGNSFLDFRNESDMSDTVSIIYGHNMINGTAFGKLTSYYGESESAAKSNVINFYTKERKYTYLVCGAFYTNAYPKDNNGYFFAYNTPIMSEEKYEKYLSQIAVRCLYNPQTPLNTSDKLLLLSTCAYQFKDERFVVVARLIENDSDISSAYIDNEEPMYPQKYYDKHHKKNPYKDYEKWYANH